MKEPFQIKSTPDEKGARVKECEDALQQSSERLNCNNQNDEEFNAVKEEKCGSSSSDTDQLNKSKTLDSKFTYNEAPVLLLDSQAEIMIETSNTLQLVNKNHSQEDLRHNSIVDNISDLPKCSEEKSDFCDSLIYGTAVGVNLSKESPILSATVDTSSQNSAQTVPVTNQCTTSVNNVTSRNSEQFKDLPCTIGNVSKDVKINVVSNSVKSMHMEKVEDMLIKTVSNAGSHSVLKLQDFKSSESTIDKTYDKLEVSAEVKNVDEKIKQVNETVDNIHYKEHLKDGVKPSKNYKDLEKQKETNTESKELSKEECLSQRSDDYDETEKSDGSDSGIGSELIDEAITKSSSDSSSSTSSDEFNSAATPGGSWVTPCISFAEMSEIDFGAAPRLSIPTFDDLTMTCDVFTTEKKQIEVTEKKQAGAGQDELQHSGSSQLAGVAPNSESKSGTIDSDEDIDISSIDDDQPNKCEPCSFISAEELPETYVPATLLRELSSIPSTSRQTTFKSNLKRTRGGGYGESVPAIKRFKSQGIQFDSVSVYYFPRTQGFTCVPSQGGSTLGMSWHHSHVQTFTLSQYAQEQKRVHQRMDRSPLCPGTGGSISGGDSNDDSDSDEPLSDAEFDSDSSYTLQPVKIRQRRAMLRAAGVDKIDPAEKNQCKQIRISREFCGCTCDGFCDPEICACALAGIKCQVDRQSFPCGCSRDCCANPKGRIEFNPVRVHSHFIQTMMRMKAQKKDNDDMPRMYDYQQFHNYHPTTEYEPSSLSSYYPHHHPQYLASHHHHHMHNELLSNFELHSCYEPFNSEMSLYNNMTSSHEKMGDTFSELMTSSYTGESFNNNSTSVEMYNDMGLNNGYPYSTAAIGYQREDLSNNGTEQYAREQSSAGVLVGNEMSSYEVQSEYTQLTQHYPSSQAENKSLESGLSYEPQVHFSLNESADIGGGSSLGLKPAVATSEDKPCTLEADDEYHVECTREESENFGEIISKTMAEEVIV